MRLSALVLAGMAALALGSAVPTQAATQANPKEQTAVLAGGCFWGLEAVFERMRGVSNVVSGYSGGSAQTANYEMVSTGTTGHAESVKITFDPAQVSYATILRVYFTVAHDPTLVDRQGMDAGTQYRSEIFFTTPEQQAVARATIAALTRSHVYGAPIVTKVDALRGFYPAEEYHQHFYDRNPDYPYIVYNDKPKVEQLIAQFPKLVKAGT